MSLIGKLILKYINSHPEVLEELLDVGIKQLIAYLKNLPPPVTPPGS